MREWTWTEPPVTAEVVFPPTGKKANGFGAELKGI
jgi:hypothetical protein